MKNWIVACFSVFLLAQCGEASKKAGAPGQSTTESAREPSPDPLDLARGFAMETQAALGRTLQAQIGERGTAGAITFCNVAALPITDSIARAHGAEICRITDRPRNPGNRASSEEARIMDMVRFSLAKETPPDPLVLSEGGITHYYFPILTNELCLQCHGTPQQQVPQEVLGRLAELYPEDEALGYGPGELRGLWKVGLNQADK